MSSTSQYTDFSDLYTGLLNAVRSDTTVTATIDQAKRYINIALQDMHMGFDYKFYWAERRAVLVTQPQYITGTVSVSQGGITITGTDTFWDTVNAFSVNNMRVGGKIRIGGGSEVYEITAVASDTSATIGSKFTQADVTDGGYTYFEDEYALASDFSRPIDQQLFSSNIPIELIDRQWFRRRYVRNSITGRPVVATILDLPPSGDTVPVRRIRLHRPPDVAYTIPYTYVTTELVVTSTGVAATTFINDTDEPLVPLRYRHAIVFHALYHWYRDKRDDGRSQEAKSEYVDAMIRISSDTDLGTKRLRLRPALASYRSKAARPYNARGRRRHSLNNAFDRFEE